MSHTSGVEKINGYVEQGSWFERDTSIVEVTLSSVVSAADDFTDIIVGGTSDQIMRVMQTRGTVIGYTVETAVVAHFMFGHAAGSFTGDFEAPAPGVNPDVLAELKALIEALDGVDGTATLVVTEGFAGAVPATVTRA